MSFIPAHAEYLRAHAIDPELAAAAGVSSYGHPEHGTGIAFLWNDGVSVPVKQYRPDAPKLDDNGRPMKYVFPKGSKVPFNRLRDGEQFDGVIIAEGTKQPLAVLTYAPAHLAVYGMSGCNGHTHADLLPMKGRDIFLLLDADVASNLDVWFAAQKLTEKLTKFGAKSVRLVTTTGEGKQGVDDVLAALPEAQRAEMLRLWLSQASEKLPKRPKPKARELGDDDPLRFFEKVNGQMAFKSQTAARELIAKNPAAMTGDKQVSFYRDGVFLLDENAALVATCQLLGDMYSPGRQASLENQVKAELYLTGRELPERSDTLAVNTPGGMFDLRNGERFDHDPRYLSSVQMAVTPDFGMKTPVYDAWLREALRWEGATEAELAAVIDSLEETAACVLDPTRTPSKALFLFGPSRSGKSTFLILLRAIVGAANTSAVTLHDLASNGFASANLFGKALNVAADLSNAHVGDLSTFKMALGDDALYGNRKYGKDFTFTNQALFAFSANELPTVSEASRAYVERMSPFEFPNSFAGREDKTLVGRLMAELPGVMARWVTAYGRFLARGGYAAPSRQATIDAFEAKSDRVAQFFQDMCTVTPAKYGVKLASEHATGRRPMAEAFNAWAERNGGSKMGERAFFQRFSQIPGVTEVKTGAKNHRAFNVTLAQVDEDVWTEGEAEDVDAAPVAQPVVPSAAAVAASQATMAPVQAPEATGTVTGPQTAAEDAWLKDVMSMEF